MYSQYMCILLYVKLIWYNSIPRSIVTLGDKCMFSICAF